MLVRGATQNSDLCRRWTKRKFLKRHGEVVVSPEPYPYAQCAPRVEPGARLAALSISSRSPLHMLSISARLTRRASRAQCECLPARCTFG